MTLKLKKCETKRKMNYCTHFLRFATTLLSSYLSNQTNKFAQELTTGNPERHMSIGEDDNFAHAYSLAMERWADHRILEILNGYPSINY